ncbi:MAG: PEGA domain-containing protein [Saccharospirillaceae bacterium]|nr:PEGA domain-containing protein [Colwellia sp.]NRB77199.1 PEGA domain-containing protein [Saccharospirillaceae bacterium]
MSNINQQKKQTKLSAKHHTNQNKDAVPFVADKVKKKRQYKLVMYLISSLFITGLILLGYIFTAKSVVITSSPPSQEIEITGGLYLKWQDHLLMLPGQYQVKVIKPDYSPLEQHFTVDTQQNQRIHFTLTPLPGNLALEITPDVDIRIMIDDQVVNINQHTVNNIAAGPHQLVIHAENYFSYQSEITIEGKNKTQQLVINLIPAWGNIMINSEPLGVQVYENEVLLGTTPLNAQLLEGEHPLHFKKQGYKATQRAVAVKAGQTKTIKAVKLFKLMGRLAISTSPKGVNISYGDKFLGTSPLNVTVSSDKELDLLLFKEGYQSQSHSLIVASDQTVSKFYQLLENNGVISFAVTPNDALLYIDGRLMGRASQQLSLPIKRQTIRVEKEGYISYQSSILPNLTMEQRLSITLKTEEQARWENLKSIITSTVGNKLKLFKPNDTFVMGASRREQGRRANEVKRKVQITKAFYLGFTEITNKEFRQFQREHSSGHIKGNSLNGTHQPAVKLTWQQAALFCNWISEQENLAKVYEVKEGKVVNFDPLANGYRLPTETEWVWAARFHNGEMLKYSWGPSLPPKVGSGNFADIAGAPILGTVLATYNDNYIASAPVGSFRSNEKGLFDLSGNVAEWLHDYYQIQTGLSLNTNKDPMGPESGNYHVIRGASWEHGTRTELRLSFRDYGKDKRNDLGFRIARNAQ